jgi:molybdopterin-guanine dinucleotide biosynthesis protein A
MMLFQETSLLVLAGGESSRMGYPKHLLPVCGGTMIDNIVNNLGHFFSEVIIAGRDLELNRTDVKVVEDIRLRRCPLIGILSGMRESNNPNVFVMGCDMPFVKPEMIQFLISRKNDKTDIVIPIVRGYFEPLCAVYSCSTSDRISHYLNTGCRKVTGIFRTMSVMEIPEYEVRSFDPLLESFINLNTPNEYRNYNLS